jgi:coatomer subunit beta'
MDPAGKLIYTRNQEVLSVNLSTLAPDGVTDGTPLPLAPKEMGTTELFARELVHAPNGRFVTVLGDGEHIVYTAIAWRNKAFGPGDRFAWAADSNTYAVADARGRVRVWRNFKERTSPPMKGAGGFTIDGLHGGALLAARASGFVVFWDWETGEIVRRIDVDAKNVSSGHPHVLTMLNPNAGRLVRLGRAGRDCRRRLILCASVQSGRLRSQDRVWG